MKNIFDQRIKILRNILSLNKDSTFYTSKTEDVIYLSGFKSTNSHLFVLYDEVFLLTDRRYLQQLSRLKANLKYDLIQNDLIDSIQKFLKKKKIKQLIFENSKITLDRFLKFKKIENLQLKPATKDLGFFFAQQDSFSIGETKKAIKITHKIFKEILNDIREGITEVELKAELRYKINKLNAGEAFEPIVLFGKNTSFPHGQSSIKKLKKNEPVLIDFGVNVNGYNSDITRTIFFGKPSNSFLEKYNLVRTALKIAMDNIKSDIQASIPASLVVEYIKKFGLDKNFTHALGHGLGVYLHNYPRLSTTSQHKISKNMILAIEPALYFTNKFGIRIEQDILVTDSNVEILTETNDELIIL